MSILIVVDVETVILSHLFANMLGPRFTLLPWHFDTLLLGHSLALLVRHLKSGSGVIHALHDWWILVTLVSVGGMAQGRHLQTDSGRHLAALGHLHLGQVEKNSFHHFVYFILESS